MKISFLLLALFGLFAFVKRAELLDNGQELFFPEATYKKVHEFTSFQITTWSQIILEDEKEALDLCHTLREKHAEMISKIMCETKLIEFAPVVKSYLSDQFLIFPAPTATELNSQAAMELAKLTVLMGPESENILGIMRFDPLDHKATLLSKVQSLVNNGFEMKNGLMTHKKDNKFVIPVQFSFKPDEIQKTKIIQKVLDQHHAVMIGAYEGFSSNRTAIEEDLDSVGLIGTLMLILFVIFVIYLKLYKLIKLIIPTALGICVSFVITWLIYGRVHGITLAFGTGIIGLAIDYGFHYVFSKDKGMAWKSNLYALLTTLVVFFVFIFSSVPLIRQMMVFSIIGLVASYLFSRLLLINDHIEIDLKITLKKSKWHALSILVAFLGIFHFFSFKVDTSIQRFNYIPAQVKKAQSWFFTHVKREKIYFKVYETKDLAVAEADSQKLVGKDVRQESVFSYLPSSSQQQSNLDSWLKFKESGFKFSGNEAKLFAPFTQELETLTPERKINFEHPPEYLSHLVKDNKLLTMWFTSTASQEAAIKSEIKDSESLLDIFVDFTNLLSKEINLFMPLTLVAILGLLMFRYVSFKKAAICLIPFLFSLGLYGILYRYFNFPLSFMSLLGIFLIYGLSVDYGIFSTDYFMEVHRDESEESSLNLSLLVNWISGIVGFLPMLWCQHPILHDLGLVLVVGMVSIFYSTFFVIPALFDIGKK